MWQTLKKEETIEKLNTNEKQGLTEEQVRAIVDKSIEKQIRRQKKRKYTNKIHQTI